MLVSSCQLPVSSFQLPALGFSGGLKLETGDWKLLQNVEPTANRNLKRFSKFRLLSSTLPRDGFMAKISRNGTFRTGMKKRISAPVDVLNALVCPIMSVTIGNVTPLNGL